MTTTQEPTLKQKQSIQILATPLNEKSKPKFLLHIINKEISFSETNNFCIGLAMLSLFLIYRSNNK